MKTTVWHFFFILRIQCLVEDDTFSTFHFVEHSFRISSTLPYSKPFFSLDLSPRSFAIWYCLSILHGLFRLPLAAIIDDF